MKDSKGHEPSDYKTGVSNTLNGLEALERLKEHTLSYAGSVYKESTNSRDEQMKDLNAIEKELIFVNALRRKLDRKVKYKEYFDGKSNSYRLSVLLAYELREQWNEIELEALKQFLLTLSGFEKELKALEIIKREPSDVIETITTYDTWEEYIKDYPISDKTIWHIIKNKSEGVYFCLNNDYRTINHFVADIFGEQGVYDEEKLVLVKTENDKYFLNKDYLDWRWNYDEQHFFNLFRN